MEYLGCHIIVKTCNHLSIIGTTEHILIIHRKKAQKSKFNLQNTAIVPLLQIEDVFTSFIISIT